MSSSDQSSLNQLPLSLILQIDAVARRAERAWRSGTTTSLEAFLKDVSPEGESALLEELLSLEADVLRRRGEEPDGDGWRKRFPQHLNVVERVLLECEGNGETTVAESEATQSPFPRIRGYTIQRELGRGAMGVVYLAEQVRLGRLVAVKIVAPGLDLSQAFNLIRAEAEIIARLRHPNIVQVYDVGKDHGVPFLTIEFVDGESLRDKLAREAIPQREAAELVEQLARAMHHAHASGVVHRDLKPANILLPKARNESTDESSATSRPATPGPKITDFGLAKVLDALHEQTVSGSFLGTPKYMSPEQADGRSREIGPLTDVYALGAILFEILTGKAPFEADSSLKLLQRINTEEATFPESRERPVPADLQSICLKCLEKAPVNRYASALELADDIRRYLDDFPIIATRPSRMNLAVKFARRNRLLVASILMVCAAILAGVVGVSFFAVRESRARRFSEVVTRREVAAREHIESLLNEQRQSIYWANLRMAEEAWHAGRLQQMQDLLQQISPQQSSDPDLRGFEWFYLSRLSKPYSQVLNAQPNEGRSAFSPSGSLLATPFGSGPISLWNTSTGKPVRELRGHSDYVLDLAFSPSGTRLASASRDGTVRIWDVDSGKQLFVLEAHAAAMRSLAFSPDGHRLVTADEVDKLILWNADDGQVVWTLSRPEWFVMDLDYCPDGRYIALGSGRGTVSILNADTGTEAQHIQADHGLWMTGIAFSPEGKRLVTCGGDKTAKVWELASLTKTMDLAGHSDWLTGATFSGDGTSIATSSRDGTVRIWNASTGRCQVTLKGHSNWAMNVAYSADRSQIASGSLDGTVRLWNPRSDWEVREIPLQPHDATCLAIAGGGRQLIIGSRDGFVSILDEQAGKPLNSIQAHSLFVSSVAVSPDGKSFATASHDRTVKVWSLENCKERFLLQGHSAEVLCVTYDPRESRIATSSRDGKICLWDADTGELILEKKVADSPVCNIAFSPDGQSLATVGPEETQVWDTTNWRRAATFKGHTRTVYFSTFSADGSRLATCSADQTIRIWNTATSEEVQILKGHTGDITSVVFSKDGRRLVSSSHDGTVRVWDTKSGRELMTFTQHTDWVNCVTFSPSEDYIVSGSNDRTVKLIELRSR